MVMFFTKLRFMRTDHVRSRQDRADLFRERLREALDRHGSSASRLATAAGIDRSTLTQLSSAGEPRLPGGHALAGLAHALGVTSDWLLGLADDPQPVAAILDASVQITDVPYAPADQNLLGWLNEARGYKIRHVPLSLPSLLKTEAVLRHEYDTAMSRTSAQAIAESRQRLAYARDDSTDYEICLARQAVEGFARGEHLWHGLAAADRREQLERMATLLDELYPSVRLHLYDVRRSFAAPMTVFGPLRAAVYVGHSYLVFNATAHIRALSQRFDALIRVAEVQANEAASYTAAWARRVS